MSFTPCPRCVGGQIIDGQCLQCSHEVEQVHVPTQRTVPIQMYIDKDRIEKQEKIAMEIRHLHAILAVIDHRIAVYKLRKHPRLASKQYQQQQLVEAQIALLEFELL